MSQNNPPPKLTSENWDSITQKTYHLNFINERNAIRAVLYDLLQIDNDIKCTNAEIQSLKTVFDQQLNNLEEEVKRIQEDESLDQDKQNRLIDVCVKEVQRANANFSKKVDNFQLKQGKSRDAVIENIELLAKLKSEFDSTHRMQVESLKKFRLFCEKELRSPVEVRMKSIDRKFCDELFYIASCEKELKHIFSLLDNKEECHGRICASSSICSMESFKYLEFLSDFAWMRNEQVLKRSALYDYFKIHLAKDIVSALTAMYIYQPEEPIKFIATFLKQVKKMEFHQKTQGLIFNAAKNGESLFPVKRASVSTKQQNCKPPC